LPETAESQLDYGDFGFYTYIHEVGHALGLSHPGPYNYSATYEHDHILTEDNRQYSVMSYFGFNIHEIGFFGIKGGWLQDGSDISGLYPSTPMVFDILAIQSLYGADYETRKGDSVYGFNVTADVADYEGVFDFTQNKNPIFTIWDGWGNDTLDCSGFDDNQTISLEPGSYSSIGGMIDNI